MDGWVDGWMGGWVERRTRRRVEKGVQMESGDPPPSPSSNTPSLPPFAPPFPSSLRQITSTHPCKTLLLNIPPSPPFALTFSPVIPQSRYAFILTVPRLPNSSSPPAASLRLSSPPTIPECSCKCVIPTIAC
ncbi:hypothetical protein E2C01_094781 [Portunus trituberculatus]|uniref:Uncharacterized protein n=1 Tax=Portunus trituberculatus TaxID=210409 RepID=A0A5B7JN28_PORTR|nr:hypothetical protein [Portunus trituberculatus]